MQDSELFAFMETFGSVQRIFPLRGESHELRQVGASYFKALRRFPLRAVQDGAEVWINQGKRFPKPAEWVESIPKRAAVSPLTALSDEAARAWLRAESLKWEDAPCSCQACVAAGISAKPLRFVPEVDARGMDAKALIGDRAVVTGRWIHGQELARWYVAKDAFWNRMLEMFGADSPQHARKVKRTFEQRMKEIFREPPRTDQGGPFEPLGGAQ